MSHRGSVKYLLTSAYLKDECPEEKLSNSGWLNVGRLQGKVRGGGKTDPLDLFQTPCV